MVTVSLSQILSVSLSVPLSVSTLCYCICGGTEKDITKDSQQRDENRLGQVCLRLNKPWQERVIFRVLCKLQAGCPSFALQINCACFSPDNTVCAKVYWQQKIDRPKKNHWYWITAPIFCLCFFSFNKVVLSLTFFLNLLKFADSFNFNPHKWLLVNFDCSAMW